MKGIFVSKGWGGYHDGVELTEASEVQGIGCKAGLRIVERSKMRYHIY